VYIVSSVLYKGKSSSALNKSLSQTGLPHAESH